MKKGSLEKLLSRWASERLAGIGVYEGNVDCFDKLRKTVISDLRSVYSDRAIELFLEPVNMRVLKNPDGYARIKGPCGDTMEVYIRVEDGRISEASFRTDGCEPSIAAGGMAAELATGTGLAEAAGISRDDILTALGRIPQENHHCALLASNTLRKAVEDCIKNKK
ncbi:MAG: iron-sulfur cluster assembly scaffold protein [Elusimicrobia bacterium]|nr:iron-sulfur cluster assembly scaffold protein [Elusimicrobiota bacterium]